MHKLKHIVDGLKFIVAYCIANILRLVKSNRDIWLIGERKDEAKDNGYHLFKYIRENHREEKVYYVIDKNSKDLDKIQSLGNIVYADSFKHYIYYVMANKLIMAHLSSCVPDSPVCWKVRELEIVKYKKIFIQHGITKELIPSLMYENTKADLFICGAKPEYDFVKSEFGYPEGSVKYTGFARFDNLHDFEVKNQILVMPTWRQWIPSMTWSSDNREECKKIFIESEYYKKFNELINDNEIKDILDKNDMRLIFYPHHEMQGYIELFKNNSDRVVIAKENEFDVQQLLKESKILITDYSSVAFDFAYMRKPIIYYQFDSEEYYNKHYSKGYFQYNKDGFGMVAYSQKNIIKEIDNILANGIYKSYKHNIDKFFKINDSNNNYRIYRGVKMI